MGRGVGCIESTALIEALRWLSGAEPGEGRPIPVGLRCPILRRSYNVLPTQLYCTWFSGFGSASFQSVGPTVRRPIQLQSATRRPDCAWTVGIASVGTESVGIVWCTPCTQVMQAANYHNAMSCIRGHRESGDERHRGLLPSFVSWLSERQSAPARSSCLQFSSCVSVYRPSSVRRVPLPYHRCHCWRRHQRHQPRKSRTNLCRWVGDRMNTMLQHENDRLPRNT